MSELKTIGHKKIMVSSLVLSITALPFSLKVCHAGMIVLLTCWLFEGNWDKKLNIIKSSILLQLTLALFLIQLVGLIYSDNITTGWFTVEKKIFFLLVPVALATTKIKLSEQEIKLIFYSFLASCFIGSLLCILHAWDQTHLFMAGKETINQYLSTSAYHDLNPFGSEKWLMFSYVSLSEGINIHPTFFSLYLAFCIIFFVAAVTSCTIRAHQNRYLGSDVVFRTLCNMSDFKNCHSGLVDHFHFGIDPLPH